MTLRASMTALEISDRLSAGVIGLGLSDLPDRLSRMGARDLVQTDVADSGLPAGTLMAEELVAGESVMIVIFGIRQGWFRPDRRVQVRLAYDGNRRVTDVSDVTVFAK